MRSEQLDLVELQAQFRALAVTWKDETAVYSSVARMTAHPAYQQIIALGQAVVPLLLTELQREPDFWFPALRAITGADPVLPESRGKVHEMAKAWIAWGQAKGYLA